MIIEHQKEFIKGLLSYKDSIASESTKFMADNIEADTAKSFFENILKDQDLPDFGISYNDIFTLAENGNIEPIELIESMFGMVSEMGIIEHQGRKIDLSSSKDIFNQLKSNFLKHKKEEDINNF